jgi:hypothetical protein
MLFILIMDFLNYLVDHVTRKQMLHSWLFVRLDIKLLFYADDVVIFLRPIRMGLQVIKIILDQFGHASSLLTNMSKSTVSPIQCSHDEMLLTAEILSCTVKDFPCSYLGLPLSIHKPTKEVLLPLIDKVVGRLPRWKASLMNRVVHLVMVRVVLTTTPIYSMMDMDLLKWVLKAIDKRSVFF